MHPEIPGILFRSFCMQTLGKKLRMTPGEFPEKKELG